MLVLDQLWIQHLPTIDRFWLGYMKNHNRVQNHLLLSADVCNEVVLSTLGEIHILLSDRSAFIIRASRNKIGADVDLVRHLDCAASHQHAEIIDSQAVRCGLLGNSHLCPFGAQRIPEKTSVSARQLVWSAMHRRPTSPQGIGPHSASSVPSSNTVIREITWIVRWEERPSRYICGSERWRSAHGCEPSTSIAPCDQIASYSRYWKSHLEDWARGNFVFANPRCGHERWRCKENWDYWKTYPQDLMTFCYLVFIILKWHRLSEIDKENL